MDRISDRLEIQELIYRWCRGIDRRDWELARSTFHPDGHDNHGVFVGGVDDMIVWLQGRHKEDVVQSMHHIGNMLIDFVGDDLAVVESYIMLCQRYAESAREAAAMLGEAIGDGPGAIETRGAGRYVDVVERRGGVWKILRRQVIRESLWASRPPDFPRSDSWPTQSRDRNDPVYREIARLTQS